ncbi:hypothetical protein IZY60_11200 [Lutibacter sp. B2]|nr:hypothetical protein [Lutibacter sp. B2]
MANVNGIEIDEKKAQRLLKKLILMEKNNIRSRQNSDPDMVKKIKKMIEEEVGCY